MSLLGCGLIYADVRHDLLWLALQSTIHNMSDHRPTHP